MGAGRQAAVAAAGGAGAAGGAVAGKHIVIVKGVSLETSIGDVIKFFMDVVTPKNVEMKYGQAIVELDTHADAIRAMIKDKEALGGVNCLFVSPSVRSVK